MANEGSAKTGVHQICDQFVEDYAAADPITATFIGVSGYDDQLTDYSPEGHAARAALARRSLAALRVTEPVDDAERAAKAVFTERVGLDIEKHEAGLDIASLNVIASPVQDIRMIFDLMPRENAEQWATIAARLTQVPQALDSVRSALLASAEAGRVPALRQVSKVAEQADTWAGLSGDEGFFTNLIAGAEQMSDSLRADLEHGANAAQEAYADLAGFLRAELAPKAPVKDAVGAEVYQLLSRGFTGATFDLREAYEWGWAELARLKGEMDRVAGRIKPGASVAEAAEILNNDERYLVHGEEALQRWMQQLSDEALHSLRDKHFDIPDALMALECKIAPPGGALAPYYTSPNEDFSRPGRMWWPVPEGKETFATWHETTTIYHEGVPGHHLQIATGVYQADTLNRYQRLFAFTSGHAEGWALYAERLMQDLGYLDDDGALLGMLDAQAFRAVRVIIDIGMHLELEIPAGTGFHEGERWTPELGLEFMVANTLQDRQMVSSEIDRYLGWPGQAPAYKLGERYWLAARDETRQRQGANFNLKDFHTKALRLGGMGLDTLREQLALLD